MEPVLGGRDDRREALRQRGDRAAAMEPVLGGRDDIGRVRGRGGAGAAAMEPVLGGRDDVATRAAYNLVKPSRNGARPWRTGRPGPTGTCAPEAWPQWSPSLADGTTSLMVAVP